WACAISMIGLNIAITLCLPYEGGRPWSYSHPVGAQILSVLRGAMFLGAAYAFSGARRPREFSQRAGFSTRPSLAAWWAACVAAGLGIANLYGVSRGWTSPNRLAGAYALRGSGALLLLHLYRASVGPFFEEAVGRGFLYAAFRGGYGRVASTASVI